MNEVTTMTTTSRLYLMLTALTGIGFTEREALDILAGKKMFGSLVITGDNMKTSTHSKDGKP